MKKGKRLFTVKEASKYLAISVSSMYKRITNGEITATRFGRSIRLDLKVLNKLIGDNTEIRNMDN